MMLSNENDIINNDRSYNLPALVILMQFFPFDACRAVTKALIGGGVHIHIFAFCPTNFF